MVDFGRILQIEDAIKHDDGGRIYKGRPAKPLVSPSAADPGPWTCHMLAILNLPVPTWTDPGTVAGEIVPGITRGVRALHPANLHRNTEGHMDNVQEIMRKMGGAPPADDFGSYMRSGQHTLIITKYQVKRTKEENKLIIEAEGVVQDSVGAHGMNPHTPGEVVAATWRLEGLEKDWMLKKELGKAQQFVIELLDLVGTVQQMRAQNPGAVEAFLQEQGLKLCNPAQPGRGLVVIARGDAPIKTKKGNDFVELSWQAVADKGLNSPEAVAARRAWLDQTYGPPKLQNAGGSAPAPAPAPSYGHAMQPAPAPQYPYGNAQFPAQMPGVPMQGGQPVPAPQGASVQPGGPYQQPAYPVTAPVAPPGVPYGAPPAGYPAPAPAPVGLPAGFKLPGQP